jgi:hypothetical protein
MEIAAGLEVVKTTDKDLLRTLENGIRFGRPVRAQAAHTVIPQSVNTYLRRDILSSLPGCQLNPVACACTLCIRGVNLTAVSAVLPLLGCAGAVGGC